MFEKYIQVRDNVRKISTEVRTRLLEEHSTPWSVLWPVLVRIQRHGIGHDDACVYDGTNRT